VIMLKKTGLSILSLSLILVASGCGGNSGKPIPSIYANQWAGNWSSQSGNDGGTMNLQVFQDGSVTGSMTRKGGFTGSLSGRVEGNGTLRMFAGFGGDGNYDIEGEVLLNGGRLLGSMTYLYQGFRYGGDLNLQPQTATPDGD